MKLLGHILLAGMIIAALQWAVLALFVAAIVAWAVSLIRRPRETLTFMGGLALLCAFNEHPIVFIVSVFALATAGALIDYRVRSRAQHLRLTNRAGRQ